jgi:hypothetical protein
MKQNHIVVEQLEKWLKGLAIKKADTYQRWGSYCWSEWRPGWCCDPTYGDGTRVLDTWKESKERQTNQLPCQKIAHILLEGWDPHSTHTPEGANKTSLMTSWWFYLKYFESSGKQPLSWESTSSILGRRVDETPVEAGWAGLTKLDWKAK